MDCATLRRIFSEGRGPARPTEELAEAQEHARHCRSCQIFSEEERAWRAALRETLPRVATPLPVKERLFGALARARVGAALRIQRRRFLAVVVTLAVAGLSMAGLFVWRERTRDGLFVASLAEDHLLYATRPAPAEFPSDDPGVVAKWFAGAVDFAVQPPAVQGAELLGGRLCTLADRRAALWLYRRGERRLSLFEMPAQGLSLESMGTMRTDGGRYRCGHHKGVSVLAWIERDLLFALVSDLPEEDMLRIARAARYG